MLEKNKIVPIEIPSPVRVQPSRRLKIAFVNPPHADWSLANNLTVLMCQSHYQREGRYRDYVDWIPAPYKWNKYEHFDEVWEEISEADVIMFSSYVWNYTLVDRLCQHIKEHYNPNIIAILGGPHIGTNEPEFLAQRTYYDYVCEPTKPGEAFMEDFIDNWFESDGRPNREDIAWELKSPKRKSQPLDVDYSVYEDHEEYLKTCVDYARANKMEPFISFETTRGCPYRCVFCEWGGGIQTKILKKPMDVIHRDIRAMKRAGYRDAHLSDANFGVFEERDIEIFRFAWEDVGFSLSDVSTVKARNYERRKRLVDAWFNVIGPRAEKDTDSNSGTDMWAETRHVSVVPTISFQSVSEEAMKIADRTDLSLENKIKLSKHIKEQCEQYGYPAPSLELILAMPGSTIEDFYTEVELMWNLKTWNSFRHDYMFLPDSRLNSQEYKERYNIETVEVFSDIVDEGGADNWHSLYRDKKSYFKTIRSCFSFTAEEVHEMWFMNSATNYLLKHMYPSLENMVTPPVFAKTCYEAISSLPEFEPIYEDIVDIFNPETPPRSIRRIGNRFRAAVIEEFLKTNSLLIQAEVVRRCLESV